jgi:protocatechuate 3,4-dioxygenase beta subunit
MDRHMDSGRTRREILQAGLTLPATLIIASSIDRLFRIAPPTAVAQGVTLAPTPACGDDDDVTPAQTEGPYYKRRSPERTSLLESGITGTQLNLTGYVLSRRCQPIQRALLDFWQADDGGNYDNKGYQLRGHQFTDNAGRYHLETIVPGLYPGRTRHIHVKVQAPNQRVLTTQLYFPRESYNTRDRIFNPALLMQVEDAAYGKVSVFNFVLDLS